jgi:antitoxin VapB
MPGLREQKKTNLRHVGAGRDVDQVFFRIHVKLDKIDPYIHCNHMPTITARVFKSGNSQAIRLPKAWRLRTRTVQIEKTGRGLLILDPKAEAKRVKALAKLYGSCPDFPAVESLPLQES